MTTRIYLVGTDTGVGKTCVAIALLREARARGMHALAFKPAESGDPAHPSDSDRLLAAMGLDSSARRRHAPLAYDQPLAPGIAHDPAPFLAPGVPDPTYMNRASEALQNLEASEAPDLLLIEGAGGLHVPMPGGTWQPAWIRELAAQAVVVARAGLGTINHTCLTIAALREQGTDVLGFITSETQPAIDPSRALNARIVAQATGTPHLGTLAHSNPAPTGLDVPQLWAALA